MLNGRMSFGATRKVEFRWSRLLPVAWHDNRKKKQVLLRRHTGGGPLMVWDAFSFHGKSNVTIITPRQDSVKYQSYPQDNLLLV